MIGRHLGKYELLGKLGGGGMGEVFLARRASAAGVGKPVVVKVVHRRHARSEDLRAMFLDEARLAASIRHPNVAAVEDLGEEGDELYMVIEHVPGASLSQVLAKLHTMTRRLKPAMSVAVVAEAASGLHAAHEARDERGRPLNIVHRDVSPQNVLLGTQGQVKVIDFGVAKASQRLQKTTGKQLKGKLRYMAPEQLDGEVDPRTDVFALGVVIWETLTATRLFEDPDDAKVIRRILAGDVPRPSDFADVPPELEACVMRALAKNKDDRYPSAEAFGEALREACPEHLEADAVERASMLLGLLGPEIDDRSQRVGLPLVSALDTQELATKPLQAVQRWTEPVTPRQLPRERPDAPPKRVSIAAEPAAPAKRNNGLWLAGGVLALGGFAVGLGVVSFLVPQGEAPAAVTTTPTGAGMAPRAVDAGIADAHLEANEPPVDAVRDTDGPNDTARDEAPRSTTPSRSTPSRSTRPTRPRFPLADVEDPFADDL
ncbi:MAG: serine/threonine-protein kinase [Polyangiales bacterium]